MGLDFFWGESGLFIQLKKKIVERALNVGMDCHLGNSKYDAAGIKIASVNLNFVIVKRTLVLVVFGNPFSNFIKNRVNRLSGQNPSVQRSLWPQYPKQTAFLQSIGF